MLRNATKNKENGNKEIANDVLLKTIQKLQAEIKLLEAKNLKIVYSNIEGIALGKNVSISEGCSIEKMSESETIPIYARELIFAQTQLSENTAPLHHLSSWGQYRIRPRGCQPIRSSTPLMKSNPTFRQEKKSTNIKPG